MDAWLKPGGVTAEALVNAGNQNDRQAAQLKALQGFVAKTWAEYQYQPPAK